MFRRLLPVIGMLAALHQQAQSAEPVGYIEALKGRVLMQSGGSTSPIKLDQNADLARPLWAGDAVRCERGASARLRIGFEPVDLQPSKTWFVIPQPQPMRSDLREALRPYGRIGGRSRFAGLPVILLPWSPSDESAVRPDRLVLQWIPGSRDCPLTATIRDRDDRVLWNRDDVDAVPGILDDARARAALAQYVATHAKRRLELTLADACDHSQTVRFDVLSESEISALDAELATWKKATDDALLSHLGNAAIYERHRLFTEVAAEYDQALQLFPQSRALLQHAIDAHDRNGNTTRARELTDRLARSSF